MKIVNAIIIMDSKILFCEKRNYLILPGGKKEKDETDFQTLKRELWEELNIKSPAFLPKTKKEFSNLNTIRGEDIEKVICYAVIISKLENLLCKNEITNYFFLKKEDAAASNLSLTTRKIIEEIDFNTFSKFSIP